MPTVNVWKWYVRLRPTRSDELAMPDRRTNRGVSKAPPATTTYEARTSRSTLPAAMSRYFTPVALRPVASVVTATAYDSGRTSHLPVRNARRSDEIGSPLAWIGQPKWPQNPQLLHGGRSSYQIELTPVGARYGCSPCLAAASDVRIAPNMSGPGGIGYGPLRHASNGFLPASPATPMSRSAMA